MILAGRPVRRRKLGLPMHLSHEACDFDRSVFLSASQELFAVWPSISDERSPRASCAASTALSFLILDDSGPGPARRRAPARESSVLGTLQPSLDHAYPQPGPYRRNRRGIISNHFYADAILDRLVHDAHRRRSSLATACAVPKPDQPARIDPHLPSTTTDRQNSLPIAVSELLPVPT